MQTLLRGGGVEEIGANTMDYFVRPFIIPPVCPFAAGAYNVCYTNRLGKKTLFEVLHLYKPIGIGK